MKFAFMNFTIGTFKSLDNKYGITIVSQIIDRPVKIVLDINEKQYEELKDEFFKRDVKTITVCAENFVAGEDYGTIVYEVYFIETINFY